MFRTVRGWLSWKSRSQDRDIFRFWDGKDNRGIDPLWAYRALLAHPDFDWEVHPGLIDQMDSDDRSLRDLAVQASELTVQAVKDVFGVRSWTNEAPGLTESEMIGLLIGFVDYLVGVKKNTNHLPISPQHLEPTPSGTSSEEPSPTRSSLDSGSTPAAQPSAMPEESSSP